MTIMLFRVLLLVLIVKSIMVEGGTVFVVVFCALLEMGLMLFALSMFRMVK